MDSFIEIIGLKKEFNSVEELYIDEIIICKKEIVGIVGNNGSGKSTLLNLISDLLKPDDGAVLINSKNAANDSSWKSFTSSYLSSGFIFDYLFPEEYFSLVGNLNHIKHHDIVKTLEDFSTFFNNEILNQKKLIRDMSDGNKQKIGIAAALLGKPKLLLLDEPFNYLDPASQIELKKILINYNSKFSTTVVFSSNQVEHVYEICEHIILLESGRKIIDSAKTGESIKEISKYFNEIEANDVLV